MRRANAQTTNVEYTKLKRSFHRQFRRTAKHNDAKHMQWRVVVQREVDKLYRSMVEMQQSKLVGRDGENPEEAIFGVLCLLGDCVLADKWLSQWSKHIRFDFQLQNYCERIEEWLHELANRGQPADLISIQPATCQALATCLLERVFAERLEFCTVMHLAAMSGDHNMVVAVQTIWDEVIRDMVNVAQAQLQHRLDDEALRQRIEDLEGDWRCHNSLGETPYDLVPECSVIGHKKRCYCSASFNDVPCTARSARRGLLASTEAPAPLFFSGVFAIIVVAIIVAVVSLHSQSSEHLPEHFTAAEWGGIAFSYILLWTVLAVSSFIRHLWNILTLGLVLLELRRAPPSCRPPPTAPMVAGIKKRRLAVRIEKILAVVLATDSPSDADLNLLERALGQSRQDMGRKQKPEYILDEELVKRAHDLLLSRREARRRAKEFAHMRKVAGKLLSNLADLEVEFRTRVDTHLSVHLQNAAAVELTRSEQFVKDPRLKDEEDMLRVAHKFQRVKELMKLRLRLEEVLGDPRDEVFEHVVSRCREARIQESRVVKERLQAIEQPRNVTAQLKTAIMAHRLDAGELQRALSAASSCSLRPDLASLAEKAKVLLRALMILEQAQTNGRKAHAQLLVSTDHDISHIDQLTTELSVFEQACRDLRGEQSLPENVEEVKELLQKWKREQGPSRILKAAVGGTDCSVLREAIAQAKEAGIGIKAARKRLSALEQKEKVKEQLDVALKKRDINQLREAVATARKAGINVDDEKEVLKKMVEQEACKEKLALARQSNREDKLNAAVASARELDIDCTAAQQQLEALMEKRLTETLQKEEARANQRSQCLKELNDLLEDPECDTTNLVDAMRVAKVVGLDIAHAVKILTERINRELHQAINPIDNDNDPKGLSDAIRNASLVNGFGATVDTMAAKKKLEEWHKQERCAKQLSASIETVENNADGRTMESLKEMIESANTILGEESELVQKGQQVLRHANAMLDLSATQRTCRVAHEQACMMHPRLDKMEKAIPEYITVFYAALDEAGDIVPEATVTGMRDQTELWKKEAKLIFDLRTSVAARDHSALAKAIQAAQDKSKNINVEPPKRTLEKLNKQAENDSLRAQIEGALNQENHNCAMLSAAIDAAKAAGLPTYDATVVLVKWTSEGRNVLSRARASRNKDRLREALEGTAAMGLGGLPEWAEAKRALEGGSNRDQRAAAKASASKSESTADQKVEQIEMGPRHPRWKTEICSHWLMHGTCSYGKERCNFAHGDGDLRKATDNHSEPDTNLPKAGSKSKIVSKSAETSKPPDPAQVWGQGGLSQRAKAAAPPNMIHSPDTSDTHSQDSYSSKPSLMSQDSGKLWSSVAQEPTPNPMPLSMLQGTSIDDALMGNIHEQNAPYQTGSIGSLFEATGGLFGGDKLRDAFSPSDWATGEGGQSDSWGTSWESSLYEPAQSEVSGFKPHLAQSQPQRDMFEEPGPPAPDELALATPALTAAQMAQQRYLQQQREELLRRQQLNANRGIRPDATPFLPMQGGAGNGVGNGGRMMTQSMFQEQQQQQQLHQQQMLIQQQQQQQQRPSPGTTWDGGGSGQQMGGGWGSSESTGGGMGATYRQSSFRGNAYDNWGGNSGDTSVPSPASDQWGGPPVPAAAAAQATSRPPGLGGAPGGLGGTPPGLGFGGNALGRATNRLAELDAEFESDLGDGDEFYDAVGGSKGKQDSDLLGSVLNNFMDDEELETSNLDSMLNFMD